MNNIINNQNIDGYREKLSSNYYDSVKATLLNLLEVAHPNMLQNNQVTEEMLDSISNTIVEDEEFNNYIDSLIQDEVQKYIKENDLDQEEER